MKKVWIFSGVTIQTLDRAWLNFHNTEIIAILKGEGGRGKRGGINGKGGGEPGDTSYSGLYGEAPPKRGAFWAVGIRKGITRYVVYKRVGKTFIRVFKGQGAFKNVSNKITEQLIHLSILRG